MERQDYPRFFKAIDEAIQGLELEARCYGYLDEPEHTELINYLKTYKEKMKDNEHREYHIWKAKMQRGLTDEQINYFLQHDTRYELLPVYSKFVRDFGLEGALKEVHQMFGTATKEERREQRARIRNKKLRDFINEE